MDLPEQTMVKTTEMHTGGEPLRIVESGYPEIEGDTVLEKRQYARSHLDAFRKFIMYEPRGHFDMYGALLVKSELADSTFGVLFIHNEGYSTMCGHAVIALGRYAVDKGVVEPVEPETQINIHCPCGLVTAYVEWNATLRKSGSVRFHSVPAFAFALDVRVQIPGHGTINVDIGYGGAFYALVTAQTFGLNVNTSKTKDIIDAATTVSEAVRKTMKLHHPDSEDLAFLYGTILTDGNDVYTDTPTSNTCVFADREVDRCPTGSGVTARLAVQYARKQIALNQKRIFKSGVNGSTLTGMVIKETKCGHFDAVTVEVAGTAYYTGTSTFTLEEDDPLRYGFLPR